MRRRKDDTFPDNGFEAWGGYMEAKIAKLEEQFDSRTDEKRESNLFKGISIYVNGYTKPSADELKLLMLKHGGVYHTYQRSSDFIIASNLPDTKVKRLTTTKIVKPEWITESLAANCVLDYTQYLLYSKHTRTQPRLYFNTQSTTKCINISNNNPKIDGDTNKETKNIVFINNENITQLKNYDLGNAINDENILVHETALSNDISPACTLESGKPKNKSLGHLCYESIVKNENTVPETAVDSEKSPLSPNKSKREKSPDYFNLDSVRHNANTLASSHAINIDNSYDTILPPNKLTSLENTSSEAALKHFVKSEKNLKDSVARTAVDPKFLSEFYNNSRLHHISTLGAGFKQYVNEMRETNDFVFPDRAQLKQIINNMEFVNEPAIGVKDFKGGKVIMHIDMDCFFVSVGLRGRPELRGLPVAVTHSTGARARSQPRPGVDRHTEFNLYNIKNAKKLSKATGISEEALIQKDVFNFHNEDLEEENGSASMSEIASCSYEARAKGVRNGMFMGAALRLCPNLRTIPYDFEGYKEVAYTLYKTIAQYTLNVEAVSCDEMYVDCTELVSWLGASVQRLARALRHEIRQKTACPCSTGFGGNRLQARLATKKAKPDGQFFLTSELVDSFMMDVKLEELPGVGRQLLQRLGTVAGADATCGALRPLTLSGLQRHFGTATGKLLYNYCRGDDPRPLTFHTVRKSVSAEVNYGIRFENQEQCDAFLRQLCHEVHQRMCNSKVVAKSITLKVMLRAEDAPVETAKFMGHGYCDSVNKTTTLATHTDDLELIIREVLRLCWKQKFDPKEMRGIGIQMSKLENSVNRQNYKNALKAFLVKPAAKINRDSKESTTKVQTLETERIVTSNINEVINNERKYNYVAEWITRTPPKENCNTEERRATTPLKSNVQRSSNLNRSPARSPQKSPSKKKCLGLTGRRRGRPPKSAQAPVSAKPSASKHVMDKFLMGDQLRTELTCSELDPEFLDALPEDIRREVLEYYQPLVPSEGSRSNTPVPTTTEIMPVDTSAPIQNPPGTVAQNSSTRDEQNEGGGGEVLSLPWRQVRELLRAWLQAARAPPPCDVELLSSYMQHMVITRRIHHLLVLINFLKRNTQELHDSSWSKVYTHILEGVQETMVAVYGKPLLVD